MCARNGLGACVSFGPLQFWSQNRTIFNNSIHNNEDLINAISVPNYPDGSFVNRNILFGSNNYQIDSDNIIMC